MTDDTYRPWNSTLSASREKLRAWKRKRKRLKPIGERGKRMREKGELFGELCDFVREMPCEICGKAGPSDPHHVKSRGAGFGDWLPNTEGNVVPLCRTCHQRVHDEPALGTELTRRAREYGERYRRENG